MEISANQPLVITTGKFALSSDGTKYYEAIKIQYDGSVSVAVDIPKKTSSLSNDARFCTMMALLPYVTKEWILGNGVSHFRNDARYITMNALSAYPTKNYISSYVSKLSVSELVNDAKFITKDDISGCIAFDETGKIDISGKHIAIENKESELSSSVSLNDKSLVIDGNSDDGYIHTMILTDDAIEFKNIYNVRELSNDTDYLIAINADGIYAKYDNVEGQYTATYSYPSKSGTIATKEDIESKISSYEDKLSSLLSMISSLDLRLSAVEDDSILYEEF